MLTHPLRPRTAEELAGLDISLRAGWSGPTNEAAFFDAGSRVERVD